LSVFCLRLPIDTPVQTCCHGEIFISRHSFGWDFDSDLIHTFRHQGRVSQSRHPGNTYRKDVLQMRKSRKQKRVATWTGVESLEGKLMLSAVDAGLHDLAAGSSVEMPVGSVGPSVTIDSLTTDAVSPQLTGTVSDAVSTVSVTVDSVSYDATNNGDGTWTLAAGTIADLSAGTYDVTVTATDADENVVTDSTTDELTIDLTAPTVTVSSLRTHVASPALSGTINDATATVVVRVNGANYTAVNDGDGTWSLAAGTIASLSAGTYNVTATATDTAGNVGVDATTNELIVDLTAPTVAITPLTTNVASPALSGTVNDTTATISVTVDGETYTAVNDGDGTWSLEAGTIADLVAGTYSVTVTATDAAGNVGTDSTSDELVIDLTAPTVTVNSLTTRVLSPALSGTINDATATIVVTVDGTDYDAVNNGDGTWSLAAGEIAELTAGTYNVTVTATDTFSNVGTDATTNELVIDLTAPTVAINALKTDAVSPRLTGTVNDNTAAISVTVNGHSYTATNNGDGTWTLAAGTIANLAAGTYSVTVTATDTAGNVGTDATANELTVDLTAPTVAITPLTTSVASPALAGTINDNTATIVVRVNGHNYTAVNDGDGTWSLASGVIDPLPTGTYSVTVRATDEAGNVGVDATSNELVIDHTAPIVTVTSLTTRTISPALSGTVNDNAATIVVTVDGEDYDAVNNGDGTWSLAAGEIEDLAAGTYSVTVTATDALSNVGTDATSNELVIDLTAPTVTVSTLRTNVISPALSGTVNDTTATISITVDGETYTAVNNGDGTWSLAAGEIADLAAGTYSVTVTATDTSGNAASDATANELVIDLTAPTVTITGLTTRTVSPALSGTVDDNAATIVVTVDGEDYTAVNDGDGTWSLAAGEIDDLDDGVYDVTATATDTAGNETTSTAAHLTIDTTGPAVTVDTLLTTNDSPALSGTIDDATATVVVTVDGVDYNAVNNGDGTWSLAADEIASLDEGVYNVVATATDTLGNIAADLTTGELAVASTVDVTLGAGLYRVVYVDLDGTTVTVASTRGNVKLTFTGVDVATTTTRGVCTVTATGGLRQLDADIVSNTSRLTIKTDHAGDGVTAINQITGNGILGKLTGTNVDLIGGIDMTTGVIKTIKLHSIQSDISMGDWARGVNITAATIINSDIDTDHIRTLKASSSFENTTVTADTIGKVRLYNVVTDNDGVEFGVQASTSISSLKIKQAGHWQTWGHDFTTNIEDFTVAIIV
jgi:hypothetical protein